MKEIIIENLYQFIKVPYQYFFKKNSAWNITIQDLIKYPQDTLGFHYGCFLLKYNFNIQESLEEHDAYHVLIDVGITVKDEIDMQFYLLGNGKRSPFVFIVIATGLLFYPFQITSFIKTYRRGKKAYAFHHLQFFNLLSTPLSTIQKTFNII